MDRARARRPAARPRHRRKVNLDFTTGLPGLDRTLLGLRPGDNVVLQVNDLADYRPLVDPFVAAALRERKPLVYFRFARHQPLLTRRPGLRICRLHPEAGFERFITEILDIIEEEGRGACYVFDCLSELAVDWYSDRMLGNFFMLACPYLFQLDTIAYFALLRNHHSPVATDAITSTAQVVVDIYRHEGRRYIHPLKVDKRYSPNLYMLHQWEGDEFRPVTDSTTTTGILSGDPDTWLQFAIHRPGFWVETFQQAKEVLEELPADARELPAAVRPLHEQLLRMAITRDERVLELARQHFTLQDLVEILQRMIGTGLIGGKSVGMLLARAILRGAEPRRWERILETHDSFYIGADVFYTFLVLNGGWWLRRRPRKSSLEELEVRAEQAAAKMMRGVFPDDIRHQFMEMLRYFGQSPIIVRSSSLLEDNYGNAFSGKYESVFCANQGTPEQRLEEFISAVRTVYASTLRREALHYRARRGLLEQDEQMALLVQRVSGDHCGDFYFPHLAGVGFSFNPYVWNKEIDPRQGLLRMVFGLGTRAVDRTEDDYTRLVSLSAPNRRPEETRSDVRKYSQHHVDVLDLQENSLLTREVSEVLPNLPADVRARLVRIDDELARRLEEQGMAASRAEVLDFDALLAPAPGFVSAMRDMLRTLEDAYHHPVDIEFTANIMHDGSLRINLLQCRPFQVQVQSAEVASRPKNLKPRDMLLSTRGPIIGQGVANAVDRVVYVVPAAYSKLGEQDRYAVARLIGEITRSRSRINHSPYTVLIAPGRWGTQSPSLGVPVTFADINRAHVLVELAVMHAGLVPDISLGTHFFNDLVEINMLYLGVFPGKPGNALNEKLLLSTPNRLTRLVPGARRWEAVVRVLDARELTPGSRLFISADPVAQRAVLYFAAAPD